MNATRAAIIVGGAAVGVFLLSRIAKGATSTAAPDAGPKTTGGFVDLGSGVPGLGPAYALLKPLQPVISGGLGKLNSAIGGTDVYGPPSKPVKNANGEFTAQQGGATITYHKDGTITRRANGLRTADVLKGVGHATGSAVSSVGHAIAGLF